MSTDYDTCLCFISVEGRHELRAVYDNEHEAEAWLAGVNAAYSMGYVMVVDANCGPIDFDSWLKEAETE